MQHALSRVYSAELEGIRARLIEVETDLNVGLHSFTIVGLADKALNEAKERVNSAIKNSSAKPPNRENRRITVNLAPADIKKTGSQYDLAIAIGYLLATKQILDFETGDKIFTGELSLDGRLRPINGALNIAHLASVEGYAYLLLPKENAREASVIQGVKVIPLESLEEAIQYLEHKIEIEPSVYVNESQEISGAPDISEIKGQESAKRALTIAAAGAHNVIFIGPPGVGKSMLAQTMVGIMPRLTLAESIEVTKIYSAAGLNPGGGLITARPFRTPHQSASPVAVVGGGSDPKPGEISLAHRGILFLDELPEFQKNILESLRQPIESGVVHVARAKQTLSFPAKFTLVAAMNPCPCGYYGDDEKECRCAPYEVIRYQKKISGPLLDRIDLQIKVRRVNIEELRAKKKVPEESGKLREIIKAAREKQGERFKKAGLKIRTNSEMSSKQTDDLIEYDGTGEAFLKTLDKSRLSPRGYYRLLKTARTIADLEAEVAVTKNHLAEAFSYRLKEGT
jgi:magnesium chelatase family protein